MSATQLATLKGFAKRMSWHAYTSQEYKQYLWWAEKARKEAKRCREAGYTRLAAHYLTEARFWRMLAQGVLRADDALEVIGYKREKNKEAVNE